MTTDINAQLNAVWAPWDDEAFTAELVEIAVRKGIYPYKSLGTLDLTSNAPIVAIVAVRKGTGRYVSCFGVTHPTTEVLEAGKPEVLAWLRGLPDAPSHKEWSDALLAVLKEDDGALGASVAGPAVRVRIWGVGDQWAVLLSWGAVHEAMLINPTLEGLREWSQEQRTKIDSIQRRGERIIQLFENHEQHLDELERAWLAASADDDECPEDRRCDLPRRVRREPGRHGGEVMLFEAPCGAWCFEIGAEEGLEISSRASSFVGFLAELLAGCEVAR